jgi:Tfp pilus assembly protein PilF
MLTACFVITGIVLLLILRSAEIQSDAITYEINQVSGTEQSSGVKKEVLEYLLLDELEQSSYKKILTRSEFSKTYPGKIPAAEVTLNVQNRLLNTEIKVEVHQASVSPLRPGATYDTTHLFSEPSKLLKDIMPGIGENVLRVVGIIQKKTSSFTHSWEAFDKFYQGERAWQKLEVSTARQAFQQALHYDSSFVLARLRFADTQWWLGANTEAQANVSMIKNELGKLSAVDSLRGEALIAKVNSDLMRNVQLLGEVLERKPYAVESQFSLAEGYFLLFDIENAKYYYERALVIDSNYAKAHNHLAYCYTHLGEHPRALEEFQKYLYLDSTANSYDSYGDGLFAAGFLDSAAWAKERGISLDHKMYYAYESLFYIRLFQGQLKKAEKCIKNYRDNVIEKSLRAKVEYFYALLDYFRNKDTDALNHCRAALHIFDEKDIATRDHELHWLLGLLYLRTGQQNLAKRELDDMEALVASNNVNATNYRRYLYKSMLHLRTCLAAKRRDVRAVDKFAEEELEVIRTKVKDWTNPFDLSFFYTSLGQLYRERPLDRVEYAEEYLIKSLKYNPRFPFAHHQLWLLYQRMNKPEQAAEHFRILKEIWKDADPEWRAIYLPEKTKK